MTLIRYKAAPVILVLQKRTRHYVGLDINVTQGLVEYFDKSLFFPKERGEGENYFED